MTRDRARILDASANRAAEALRVMEDAARFLLDDRDLTAQLKALRHDLRALTPSSHHRDAAGDVGTTVSTEAETFRSGARPLGGAAPQRPAPHHPGRPVVPRADHLQERAALRARLAQAHRHRPPRLR